MDAIRQLSGKVPVPRTGSVYRRLTRAPTPEEAGDADELAPVSGEVGDEEGHADGADGEGQGHPEQRQRTAATRRRPEDPIHGPGWSAGGKQ